MNVVVCASTRTGLEPATALPEDGAMNTTFANSLSPEIVADMERAVKLAMSEVRDPEAMRLACERMDRMREEIRQKHGVLDIGVPAIRELRGELPDA